MDEPWLLFMDRGLGRDVKQPPNILHPLLSASCVRNRNCNIVVWQEGVTDRIFFDQTLQLCKREGGQVHALLQLVAIKPGRLTASCYFACGTLMLAQHLGAIAQNGLVS